MNMGYVGRQFRQIVVLCSSLRHIPFFTLFNLLDIQTIEYMGVFLTNQFSLFYQFPIVDSLLFSKDGINVFVNISFHYFRSTTFDFIRHINMSVHSVHRINVISSFIPRTPVVVWVITISELLLHSIEYLRTN